MALKIRCTECRKKISVDDAFAGGICRCPYCKALVIVQGVAAEATGARPDAPISRPAEPAYRPDAPPGMPGLPQAPKPASQPLTHERVPMARPVKIQGIVSLILLAMMLTTIVVVIVLAVKYSGSGKAGATKTMPAASQGGGPAATVNPLARPQEGASMIAGMPLKSPVIFCVDAASGMRDTFDFARLMVLQSVKSMSPGDRFTVLVVTEEGPKFMGDNFSSPDLGKDSARRLLTAVSPAGATDLAPALQAALKRKPAMIVLLARKALDDATVTALAEQAHQQKCEICCVVMNGDREANDSMKKLALQSGGKSIAFKQSELEEFVNNLGE